MLVGALMCLVSSAYAQSSTVYANWMALPDDTNHVDVEYRVVKCGTASVDQIHLSVFNENSNLSSISFMLTITDHTNNQSFNHTVNNYQVAFAAMHISDCGNVNYPDLKINLPMGYDPNNTQVLITFL